MVAKMKQDCAAVISIRDQTLDATDAWAICRHNAVGQVLVNSPSNISIAASMILSMSPTGISATAIKNLVINFVNMVPPPTLNVRRHCGLTFGQRHKMTNPMIDRANDVIDRLEALDKTVINASAFRILLEDLHARDLTQVAEPHVASITMVRAGILRATMGSVMSCLDRADARGNRASIGQILERLNDSALVTFFLKSGQSSGPTFAALERA